MGTLDGKVAFITGAARGLGRSFAVGLAREGADIVALDICEQVPSIEIPLATREDLEETRWLVEAEGRRILAEVGDVRDRPRLAEIARKGMDRLGRIDIVLANAGVWPASPATSGHNDAQLPAEVRDRIFRDTIDINLIGVWNTLQATVPHLKAGGRGGAIVITNSTAGMHAMPIDDFAMDGYTAAKHGAVGLMRSAAVDLAPYFIRVNTVHPTVVRTPMGQNPVAEQYLTRFPSARSLFSNAMPVAWVEAEDVTNAVLYLVTDAGRYVTGVTLPVDAGFLVGGAMATRLEGDAAVADPTPPTAP